MLLDIKVQLDLPAHLQRRVLQISFFVRVRLENIVVGLAVMIFDVIELPIRVAQLVKLFKCEFQGKDQFKPVVVN